MISRLYFSKVNEIARRCAGKKVLDIGIVDHDINYEKRADWLHGNLKRVSSKLVGIDIDKKAIELLKAKGYNAKFADAENFNLHEKFGVIVAGDVMEHLNNPGSFLDSIKKHMDRNSVFIATVPNCLSISNWIELLLFGKIKYFNEEHTAWYDCATVSRLLQNKGIAIKELSFILHNPHFIGETRMRSLLKDFRYFFQKVVCSIRKQAAPTILAVGELR